MYSTKRLNTLRNIYVEKIYIKKTNEEGIYIREFIFKGNILKKDIIEEDI